MFNNLLREIHIQIGPVKMAGRRLLYFSNHTDRLIPEPGKFCKGNKQLAAIR